MCHCSFWTHALPLSPLSIIFHPLSLHAVPQTPQVSRGMCSGRCSTRKQSFQRWLLPHCFVFTHFPSFHLNNTSQAPAFTTDLPSFIFLQHLYNLAYYHLTHLFIICHHQENLNHRKTEIHLFYDRIANVKHTWHVELKYFLKKYIILTIELIYR